jgi:hypothetical protein
LVFLCAAVGNPYILQDEPCWSWLLEYCVLHDAYMGCPLPPALMQRRLASRALGAAVYWQSKEGEAVLEHTEQELERAVAVAAPLTAAASAALSAAKSSAESELDTKHAAASSSSASSQQLYRAPAIPAFLLARHASTAPSTAPSATGTEGSGSSSRPLLAPAAENPDDLDLDFSAFATEAGGDWRIIL